MTRAMATEYAVGDPHGGPAYGERNEPVSAILAIGSMFATAGTAGAIIAGTASLTLGTVAAGLAFAGAAVSLVGNLTGNKDLMKIGSVAGMIGGLGMGVDALGNWLSTSGAATAEGVGAVGQGTVTGNAGQAVAAGPDGITAQIIGQSPVDEALAASSSPITSSAAAPVSDLTSPVSTQAPSLVSSGSGTGAASFQGDVNGLAANAPPAQSAMYGGMNSSAVTGNTNAIGGVGSDVGASVGTEFKPWDVVPDVTRPDAFAQSAASGSGGIVNDAAGGAYSGADPFKGVAGTNSEGAFAGLNSNQPGAGWKYFTNDAGASVAISPEGKYFLDGAQITGAQGQQMGLLDKAGNLMGSGWKWMSDPNNAQGVSAISGAVSGASKYFGPEAQYYRSSADLRGAQAEQTRYQTELAKMRREQLNRNLNSYVATAANPNGVTVTPPGLINSAIGG